MTPLERFKACSEQARQQIMTDWPSDMPLNSAEWTPQHEAWLSNAIDEATGYDEDDPAVVDRLMMTVAQEARVKALNPEQLATLADWSNADITTTVGLEQLRRQVERIGNDLQVIPDAEHDTPMTDPTVTAWTVSEIGAGSERAHARAVTAATVDPGDWVVVVTVLHPCGHLYNGSPWTIRGTAAHAIANIANRDNTKETTT